MKKLVRIVREPSLVVRYMINMISPLIKNDEFYLKLKFWANMGYWPDLRNPKTFNEKLQWLKLHDRKPEYITMVDKYAVKQYVAERIGEEYIIPTLGVWNSPDDIDFDSLPKQFVLKCTHDSGGLCICKDKSKLNIEQTKEHLRIALRRNYYSLNREWPYKQVEKKIIAEKFLVSERVDAPADLPDYKFFCFNGKVHCFKIDFNRFSKHQANYYSSKGDLLMFGETVCPPDYNHVEIMPSNLNKMIMLAEKLSAGKIFLRVDFYNVDGCIYFGELTFFPAGGIGSFTTDEADEYLGSLINIAKDNLLKSKCLK